MNKIIIILVILYILGTIWYFKSLNSTIDILNENNRILSKANDENNQTIEMIKERYNTIVKINSELTSQIISSNNRISKLENSFSESIKKIDRLAKSKPGLIEKKINSASDNVIKCFEDLSKGEKCEN